jgi:(4S)-4-hydroxy-5-phosphonooxypentane-2,3-dione isomerase
MSQIALLSQVKAHNGQAEALIAAFGPVLELAGKEPGTLLYALHQSADDPDRFWVCELYADHDAFALHRDSDAMAAATPALAELIAESEFMIGHPVSTAAD